MDHLLIMVAAIGWHRCWRLLQRVCERVCVRERECIDNNVYGSFDSSDRSRGSDRQSCSAEATEHTDRDVCVSGRRAVNGAGVRIDYK